MSTFFLPMSTFSIYSRGRKIFLKISNFLFTNAAERDIIIMGSGARWEESFSVIPAISFRSPNSRFKELFVLTAIIYPRTNIKLDHGLKNKLISRINLIYQYVCARLGKFRSEGN